MSAEQTLKRSNSQIDGVSDPSKPPLLPSERDHDHIERNSGLDRSSPGATEIPDKVTDAKTKGAINRSHSPAESDTELCDFSKRSRLDDGRLLKWKNWPHETNSTSAAPSSHADSLLTFENFRPSFLDIDPKRLQDPKAINAQQPTHPPPSRTLAPSPTINHSRPPNNPPLKPAAPSPARRPSLNQLSTDGQQALKVLVLIDHATKGDAIHHALSADIHPNSLEMKHLMFKYRTHRSKLQNAFFAKARTICAQLTTRHEFVELHEKGSDRGRRVEYFGGKCTKARLESLYGHLGSAVDVPRILAAQGPNEKAFRELMTQVFIHCMEDVWYYELQPCRQNVSARLEKENKEEIYHRFRGLTDRIEGLPAAKVIPGYLDVPLRAGFPRYMIFDRDFRQRNIDNVDKSDKVSDEDERAECPIAKSTRKGT